MELLIAFILGMVTCNIIYAVTMVIWCNKFASLSTESRTKLINIFVNKVFKPLTKSNI